MVPDSSYTLCLSCEVHQGLSSIRCRGEYLKTCSPDNYDFLLISDFSQSLNYPLWLIQMENMVSFLAELGLMHYPTVVRYCPSMIAASAVYAARCMLKKSPLWTETLKHHTGYIANQLM